MLSDDEIWEARRLEQTLRAAASALHRAGYSERGLCAWLGAGLVTDARYVPPPPGRTRRGLGAAFALFVAGEIGERRALPFLDEAMIDALAAAGLLSRDGEALRARVSLLPFRGVLVAADRLDDGSPEAVGSPDLSALNVAASLPRVASLLDVGCGAGALALVAARAGARVVGTDIDGHARRFAILNEVLNDLPIPTVGGHLFAGVDDRFEAVVFNAPLVRAPLAGDAPLYLRAPAAEALACEFLRGASLRAESEALCHVQLTPAVEAAAAESGFPRRLALHFADAVDGTPHALLSLRRGGPGWSARVRVPLGPALPHLHREVLDRLHATHDLSAEGALDAAVLRPAPWLALAHTATHDGAAFRLREIRLGAHRIEPADLALLDDADGRPFGALAAADRDRAISLVERGLLVA